MDDEEETNKRHEPTKDTRARQILGEEVDGILRSMFNHLLEDLYDALKRGEITEYYKLMDDAKSTCGKQFSEYVQEREIGKGLLCDPRFNNIMFASDVLVAIRDSHRMILYDKFTDASMILTKLFGDDIKFNVQRYSTSAEGFKPEHRKIFLQSEFFRNILNNQ